MELKKLKILIIEDDLIYAVKLHQWLKLLGILNIELVENAALGMENANKKPDIIFLDKELPDTKGTKLIQFFKDHSPKSSIIMMSASYDIDDVALGIHNGADFLFDKASTAREDIHNLIKATVASKNKDRSIWQMLNFFKNEKENERKNVVIVEDDELFSFHVTWILEECAQNSTIQTFGNAKDFYASYKKSIPDVIFLDYTLPETNGEEVLKFIKSQSPKATVIIISSQEDPKIALKLKQQGIEDYIIKNKNWTENLKEVIKKLVI